MKEKEQIMNEEKENVSKILEEIAEDFCENYCKYRSTVDDECECEAFREGKGCPIDRML